MRKYQEYSKTDQESVWGEENIKNTHEPTKKVYEVKKMYSGLAKVLLTKTKDIQNVVSGVDPMQIFEKCGEVSGDFYFTR